MAAWFASGEEAGPPRRFSSSPASRPIASASAAGPLRSVAISSEPSGLGDQAAQVERAVLVEDRVAGDRRAARAVEHREHRMLGG
jgi:hypothetical protein